MNMCAKDIERTYIKNDHRQMKRQRNSENQTECELFLSIFNHKHWIIVFYVSFYCRIKYILNVSIPVPDVSTFFVFFFRHEFLICLSFISFFWLLIQLLR